MTEQREVYLCEVCGNLVEMLRSGAGTLVCCDQPMTLQRENTTDAAQEKHVPVVERIGDQLKIVVGSAAHPMNDDHYIEWIEVAHGRSTMHRHLRPGEAPEAWFPALDGEVMVRAYCNLHGLWKA